MLYENCLGIFCIYDKDGILDEYRKFIIKELKTVSSELIIVVNGEVQKCFQLFLTQNAKTVIYRKNTGFDAGAYKDCLFNYVGKEKIRSYRSLVLCNDTFFGPFIPLKDIFYVLNSKNVDFWGMEYISQTILDYIRTYFMVFNHKILQSECLMNFFEKNISEDEEDINNVYYPFEVGLLDYIKKQGFRYGAFVTKTPADIYSNPYKYIKDHNLPIIKKRSFSKKSYNEKSCICALKHINEKTNYPVDYITENIKRSYDLNLELNKNNKVVFDENELEYEAPHIVLKKQDLQEFIQKYKKIYIYGTGIYGRKIYMFCKQFNMEFQGFIVSDCKNQPTSLYEYPIYEYRELPAGKNIILGLNKENSDSVRKNLSKFDQIIHLW